MTITILPTIADGSAGRDKSNLRPVANLIHYVQAIEWNTVKNAVIDLAAELGRSDGTTVGSINELIQKLGMRANQYYLFEDFLLGDLSSSGPYASSTSGSAAVAIEGNTAASGVARLSCTAATSSAILRAARPAFVGAGLPSFECRFKTPASLSNVNFQFGLADSVSPSQRVMLQISAGNLAYINAVGAPTQVIGSLQTNTWYTVGFDLTAAAASPINFYVNGAFVASNNGSNTTYGTPATPLGFFASINTTGAGTYDMLFDWYRVRGVRP